MIKKIVYTLLITLAVLFTVGYFRYNSTVNIANKIPVNTDAVIRLNLREIEYNMLKDVVKHPFLYFKSTDTSINKVDESKVSLFDGVEIPKNLFFYTNNSSLKNTWVSSAVKITDKKRLQSFFKQKKIVKSNSKLNVKYYTFKNFVCVINGAELVVFFAFNRIKNVEGKLNAVLKNKTYLLSNNAIFDKIKTSTQLVSVATNKDVFFELGVRSETLFLKGELTKNTNLFLQHNTQNNKESLVSISGKIDKNLLLGFVNNKQKKKFKKLTNLSLDSICNYWNGEINTQLISFVSKKDTILTYEYDDDFNRITKKKVQETIIPNINIKLGGKGFFDYLFFVFDEESKEEFKTIEIYLNEQDKTTYFLKESSVKENINNQESNFEKIKQKVEDLGIDFDYLKSSIEKVLKDEESQLVLSKKLHNEEANFNIDNLSILRDGEFLSIVGKRSVQITQSGETEDIKEMIRLYPSKEMHYEMDDGITSTKFQCAYDETRRYLEIRGFDADSLLRNLHQIKQEDVSLTDYLANKVGEVTQKITQKLKR